jgi:branched-chain amino acid transport system permease protein
MIQHSGIYSTSYAQDMAIFRTVPHWSWFIGILIALAVFPLFATAHILNLLCIIGITLIAVHGLNLLTGLCGQISVGQAAFMGVGAYSYALFITKLGLPFWIALPLAAIFTGFSGVFFGLPAFRVKGFYLLMTTLAAQFIIVWLIIHLRGLTGGMIWGLSVPHITIFGYDLDTDIKKYYFIMAFVILMTFFAKSAARSRLGRAFIAVRDNDLAAEVMGINLFYYKLIAFFTCSVFAGVAGALWALFINHLHPHQFVLMDSIWYLGMLIVGGMGSTIGAIFGTIFLKVLGELIVVYSPIIADMFPTIESGIFASLGHLIFASMILLFLIFEPRGISHRWEIIKASYRLHPFAY